MFGTNNMLNNICFLLAENLFISFQKLMDTAPKKEKAEKEF